VWHYRRSNFRNQCDRNAGIVHATRLDNRLQEPGILKSVSIDTAFNERASLGFTLLLDVITLNCTYPT
jgi:hypothetical protein